MLQTVLLKSMFALFTIVLCPVVIALSDLPDITAPTDWA